MGVAPTLFCAVNVDTYLKPAREVGTGIFDIAIVLGAERMAGQVSQDVVQCVVAIWVRHMDVCAGFHQDCSA